MHNADDVIVFSALALGALLVMGLLLGAMHLTDHTPKPGCTTTLVPMVFGSAVMAIPIDDCPDTTTP